MEEAAQTVVVVGASAGGVEAVTALAADLPADLDAAVCVILHLRPGFESRLAEILARAGPLPAERVDDREDLLPGRMYVAAPDCHLVIEDHEVLSVRGAPDKGFRPSIDVLFRSAAAAYRSRAIAVVLSGARDDGVAGAIEIDQRGGCVFVQSPEEARFPSMPAAAVSRDHPDRVLPLAELAAAIVAAVQPAGSA